MDIKRILALSAGIALIIAGVPVLSLASAGSLSCHGLSAR